MPLLIEGDAAARPHARGCIRRAPRAGDENRGVAEERGPPHQPAGLHQTRQEHVPDRGMIQELHAGATNLAYAAMLELRPDIGPESIFVERVDSVQRPEGYRLVAYFVKDDV